MPSSYRWDILKRVLEIEQGLENATKSIKVISGALASATISAHRKVIMKDLAIANFNVGRALMSLFRYQDAAAYLRKAANTVTGCGLENSVFGRKIIETKNEVLKV